MYLFFSASTRRPLTLNPQMLCPKETTTNLIVNYLPQCARSSPASAQSTRASWSKTSSPARVSATRLWPTRGATRPTRPCALSTARACRTRRSRCSWRGPARQPSRAPTCTCAACSRRRARPTSSASSGPSEPSYPPRFSPLSSSQMRTLSVSAVPWVSCASTRVPRPRRPLRP